MLSPYPCHGVFFSIPFVRVHLWFAKRLQTYNAAITAVVKARADAGKHILIVDMYSVLAADPNSKTALLQDAWPPNAGATPGSGPAAPSSWPVPCSRP